MINIYFIKKFLRNVFFKIWLDLCQIYYRSALENAQTELSDKWKHELDTPMRSWIENWKTGGNSRGNGILGNEVFTTTFKVCLDKLSFSLFKIPCIETLWIYYYYPWIQMLVLVPVCFLNSNPPQIQLNSENSIWKLAIILFEVQVSLLTICIYWKSTVFRIRACTCFWTL